MFDAQLAPERTHREIREGEFIAKKKSEHIRTTKYVYCGYVNRKRYNHHIFYCVKLQSVDVAAYSMTVFSFLTLSRHSFVACFIRTDLQ